MSDDTNAVNNTNSLLIVLLLVVAYPIGVLAMWIWARWSVIVKALLTVPLLLMFLFGASFLAFLSTVSQTGLR